ncbi:MAG: hypothetical protein NT069_25850 [Planctomycetota bacterium]|nr:hypothetical protein [Planctomycetota bacterium]
MSSELNRRAFHRLSVAALGGVMSGALVGCGDPPAVAPPVAKKGGEAASESSVDIFASDMHVCRGLNNCKGKGAGEANECAGQGDCATPATHHSCGGDNACKGQGGCGTTAAQNSCKGQGKCHVPLMATAWKDARAFFEKEMKQAKKEFGEAPAKKKKED